MSQYKISNKLSAAVKAATKQANLDLKAARKEFKQAEREYIKAEKTPKGAPEKLGDRLDALQNFCDDLGQVRFELERVLLDAKMAGR